MMKNFFSGYLELFKSLAVILLLLAAGSLVCFAFVWPLWYLATHSTDMYTLLSLLFFVIIILFAIVSHIRQKLARCQSSKEKQTVITTFLGIWFGRGILICCPVLGVYFVLQEKAVAAWICLILFFIFYGVYAALKKSRLH